jgi:hypothetical protein
MVCLANLLGEPSCLTAKTMSEYSPSHQPAPQLHVRIYSFAGMPSSLLREVESEAARVLRSVKIELKWMDCTSIALPASCMSARLPTDLTVRFVRKALPQVSTAALGATASSGDDDGAAFIFYDRIVALQRYARFLYQMLGRVMAHEIAHLLLPQQGHSNFGLMRGQWRTSDMDYSSAGCLGFPRTLWRSCRRRRSGESPTRVGTWRSNHQACSSILRAQCLRKNIWSVSANATQRHNHQYR